MVPAFLMAGLVMFYNYQQQRAQLVRDSMVSARVLTGLLDREFATTAVALSALATSPSLPTGNFAAFQLQADEVLRRSFINNIALIAADGQQLMNTAIPSGQPLPRTNVMSQVERVLQSGQTDISGLVVGAALKKPLTNVAVPVYADQKAATHVMSGVILPAHFQKLLVAHGLPDDRIVSIFDRSGVIVARSHEIDRFFGKSVAPALAARLKQTDEDAIEAVTLEGIAVVSTFTRSAATGWGVAIGIPEASLTADLRRAMWMLLGVAGLLLGAGLLMARAMGGQIARSIVALRAPAMDLGHGEAIHVPLLGIREVNEVGEALTKTSALMQETVEALADSEARLRGIVESAMDAIITVNESQVIVMFNAAAASMFACPAEQAIGLPLGRFVPERFHARHAEILQRQQRQHARHPFASDGVTGVSVAMRLDGGEFPAEVSFSSVVQAGNLLHTLIIRDVTRRVKAYKALERSNLDLQQFAYVASHDMKTPLRSISGFVQLLERGYADRLDDKARLLIQRTMLATRRLEQLTEDLLTFARIEAEAKPFAPVDMAEVAQEVVHMLDAAVQATQAVVRTHGLPLVRGDRTQLAQLLMNLVGNSIKYCRDRTPVVEISAVKTDREWVFSVKDNGIGIDTRHHEKVFELFKRLHTQTEYPGTGIGLAVCRRVVEGHGGRIWVSAHAGPGTTFSFTLPDESPGSPHEA